MLLGWLAVVRLAGCYYAGWLLLGLLDVVSWLAVVLLADSVRLACCCCADWLLLGWLTVVRLTGCS